MPKVTITNTIYPHKPLRRLAWHAPSGRTQIQIDFILTTQRFNSSINRARAYSGADKGSDHDRVLFIMKVRLKKRHQAVQPRIKFDWKS
jgi:endonuclease/exonuclease/phosphatase family metal-dependent hydrolase